VALRRCAFVAMTVAALVAGCATGTNRSAKPRPTTVAATTTSTSTSTTTTTSTSTTTTTVVLAPEGWQRLPEAPIGLGIYGVWTGHEYIAGTLGCCDDLDGTAVVAYSPTANRWRRLSPFPLPARANEIAVWTGHEMIVTGGSQSDAAHPGRSGAAPVTTGAALDPATDRWRRIAPMPATMDAPQGAVWTGREVVVFDTTRTFRYDPATDRWRTGAPPPFARNNATVVWSGSEMLVWSGNRAPTGSDPSTFADVRADGAAYNPTTDKWRAIPTAPVPARNLSEAVWTGHAMLAWGGSGPNGLVGRGAAYNPATNTWRALPLSPLKARISHQIVWTGREMLVWGGQVETTSTDPAVVYPHDGAAYDPATNTWRRLAAAPPSPPAMRSAWSAVWTGTAALFVGGATESLQGVGPLGLSYTPGR
jgi:N-acetylneuraminic acid mutarotase